MIKYIPLILTTLLIGGCYYEIQTQKLPSKQLEEKINEQSFKIANWNLKVYGKSKASKPNLLDDYEQILENNYDIIFVQEIRDSSQTAFPKLCERFENYNCEVSSRAGQTTSKEQNGIIFKKGIEMTLRDYNKEEFKEQFNRPPIAVDFRVGNYTFTAMNIHTDPDVVPEEMTHLESIVLNSENYQNSNFMIIGDLNADCKYYNNEKETHFDSWNWLIKDDGDTTLSKNDCSYDRIIINDDMTEEYLKHGVLREGINSSHSDHYLVWGEFKLE